MINPQWVELPISRTNVHGPKNIRVIAVRPHVVSFDAISSLCSVIMTLPGHLYYYFASDVPAFKH